MLILSIITPVYNNIDYIEKCIQNVISQEYTSVEHLIIDGGSDDGTLDVIKTFAKEYPHINWLSEKDKGQSDAMNKGIKLAKGKYIGFLNADDFYSKNTFKRIYEIIESENAPSFIVGDCNVWNEKNELIYINRPYKLKPWHILSGYYFPVNPSAYFYQKEIHTQIGEYKTDNHFNMDVEFLIEASLAMDLTYFPEVWGNFRLLPDTKTGNEQKNGQLEFRKQELFRKYLTTASGKIKRLTVITFQYEFLKRKLIKWRKRVYLPFDMIYWKIKKSLNR